jgi:hypothetical protein
MIKCLKSFLRIQELISIFTEIHLNQDEEEHKTIFGDIINFLLSPLVYSELRETLIKDMIDGIEG